MSIEFSIEEAKQNQEMIFSNDKKRRIRRIDSNQKEYSSNLINFDLDLTSDQGILNPKNSFIEIPYYVKVVSNQDIGDSPYGVTFKNSSLDIVNSVSIKYNDNTVKNYNSNLQTVNTFKILSTFTEESSAKLGSILNFAKNTGLTYEVAESTSGVGESCVNDANTGLTKRVSQNNTDDLYFSTENLKEIRATRYYKETPKIHWYFLMVKIPLPQLDSFFENLVPLKSPKINISIQFHTVNFEVILEPGGGFSLPQIYNTMFGYNPLMLKTFTPGTVASLLSFTTGIGGGDKNVLNSCYLNYEMVDLETNTWKNYFNSAMSRKLISFDDYIYKKIQYTGGEMLLINNNISKLKSLLIVAQLGQNINGNATLIENSVNAISPMESPYTHSLCLKSIGFSQLNVFIDSNPIFPRDIQYDYDMYLNMMNSTSVNGGLDKVLSSGLINFNEWQNGGYGFLYFDLKELGDNKASFLSNHTLEFKAITNSKAPSLTLHTFTFYEKQITINAETSEVTTTKL